MQASRSSSGFSLIEVLVALFVIAIGVLGAVALQSRAVQAALESSQRSQALLLAEDMVDRIKNNRKFASCYSGDDYLGVGAVVAAAGCSVMADVDRLAWDEALKGAAETQSDGSKSGAMVEARGCVVDAGGGIFRVSVAWKGVAKLQSAGVKDGCAAGEYEHEDYRRVISVSLRITNLT